MSYPSRIFVAWIMYNFNRIPTQMHETYKITKTTKFPYILPSCIMCILYINNRRKPTLFFFPSFSKSLYASDASLADQINYKFLFCKRKKVLIFKLFVANQFIILSVWHSKTDILSCCLKFQNYFRKMHYFIISVIGLKL